MTRFPEPPVGDDELGALLCRALTAEADTVEPAGDGLRRIRERTATGSRWTRPVLTLAGAAALVATLVAVPAVLPDPDPAPTAPAAAAATAATAAPTVAPTPPSVGYPLIPGAGVNDQATVWPYGSRAAGYARADEDQAAGTYGDLTKPDLVALRFVGSYVGSARLTAVSAGDWKAGLRMEVRWQDRPASLVYLVRVRIGDDAPYVVVDAIAPAGSLTMNRPPVPSTGPVTARGTASGGAVPRVQLRTPGQDTPLAATPATISGARWTAPLTLPPGVRTAALAAWTVDATGDVTAFVALPLH